MRLFAIVLDSANATVEDRVEREFPGCYSINKTAFLVSSDGLAETIAATVGIKGDDRVEDASGVVFRLNGTFAGYSSRALWDWLEQAESNG